MQFGVCGCHGHRVVFSRRGERGGGAASQAGAAIGGPPITAGADRLYHGVLLGLFPLTEPHTVPDESPAVATADLSSPEEARAAIERFRGDVARVREQIQRAVVGHTEIVDGVLTCLFTGGHALLEGVPGLGKTLLIRSLAGALSLSFSRVQFTPDLMPADIVGTTVVVEVAQPDGSRSRQFVFQKGPIFAQIVLADEINRATPKTQSALLEAMQEKSVTVGGTTYKLERPFFVMATQNPIEQEGTYPLPEAQLDRFFFKLHVGYSGREELSEILNRTTAGIDAEVEPVMSAAQIVEYQKLVHRAQIAPHVQDYAVRVVLATHPKGRESDGRFSTPMVQKYVRVGASPRAAQALVLSGKCQALLDGRAAVAVDDVRKFAMAALRHRIILNFEAEADGVTQDAVIENILSTLPLRAE
jgi:MoxR-like ATPase